MFRTIEISDSRMERDGLRFVTVKSSHLKGRGDITLYIPEAAGEKGNLPLVILLHGVYGSHWAWSHKGNAHITARDMIRQGEIAPCVLAMPSDGLWGDGTAYLPHQNQNFENWIVQDVPRAAALATGCISEKSSHFIAGLSMGGFGAMRLGCKYQNKFRGISAHSAITNLNQLAEFVEEPISSYNSPDVQWRVLDLMKNGSQFMPPLRFDCGLSDPLLEANRELNRQLNLRGVHHIYEEFEGGHDWNYWETHLRDTLRFFSRL